MEETETVKDWGYKKYLFDPQLIGDSRCQCTDSTEATPLFLMILTKTVWQEDLDSRCHFGQSLVWHIVLTRGKKEEEKRQGKYKAAVLAVDTCDTLIL